MLTTDYAKYLFFIFVNFMLLSQTMANSARTFSRIDCILLSLYIIIVLIVQTFIVLGANKLILGKVQTCIALVLFFVLDAVLLYAIFFSVVASSVSMSALGLIVGSFVLFTLFRMMDDYRVAAIALPALALIGTVFNLGQLVLNQHAPQVGPQTALPANVRFVKFNQTPNVYFLSLDALAPRRIIEKYLNLKNSPAHDVLDEHFLNITNLFATHTLLSGDASASSLNRLLAFDPGVYLNAKKNNRNYNFFSGLEASPLLEIFKRNGYTTNTFYFTDYFGSDKGPYVDNYFTESSIYSFCNMVDESIRPYILLGYCQMQGTSALNLIGRLFKTKTDLTPADVFMNRLRIVRQEKAPQFFLAYITLPVHVRAAFSYSNPHDVDAYRQSLIGTLKDNAALIERIIDFMKIEDPTALVFVFGDHGMYLSAGTRIDDDRRFFVQDRLAVYGGIYPRERCAQWLPMAYTGAFSTLNQAANMIFQCLSNGEGAFVNQPDYQVLDSTDDRHSGESYANFLYE